MFAYANQVSADHLSDLDAKLVYRKLVTSAVINELPFAARPMVREELDGAVKDIQDNFYLMRSLQHAQDVASAADRHDFVRLEKLHMSPPTRSEGSKQNDAMELGRSLFEEVASMKGTVLKPKTVELLPLDLVFAPNTILGIGAHSGTGKSALGEQLLRDLTSQGAMVLDLTLELDAKTRSQRYLQHTGGVELSPKMFQEQRVKPVTMLPHLDRFMWLQKPSGTSPGVPRRLHIVSTAWTLTEVITAINAFVEEHAAYTQERIKEGFPEPGPPVVMIDFIQQVSVPHLEDSIYQKVNAVVETLFSLSKARGLAMIWVSQLRKRDRMKHARAGTLEEELPNIDEFEGTPRIGNLVHTALFLHEPREVFERNGHKKIYAHMPKVRSGERRTLEGLFTGSHLSFDFDPSSIRSKI